MLSDLEAMGIRVADQPAGEPLRLATLRTESGLRLRDRCLLDAALGSNSILVTFDDAMASAARQLGVTVAPGMRTE